MHSKQIWRFEGKEVDFSEVLNQTPRHPAAVLLTRQCLLPCWANNLIPRSWEGHTKNWEFIYPMSLLCPRPFSGAQLTMALNYERTSCDLERLRVWTLMLWLPPLLQVTGPQQQPKGTQLIFKYNHKFKNHFFKIIFRNFKTYFRDYWNGQNHSCLFSKKKWKHHAS